MTKQFSKYSSGLSTYEEEGLIGFSNKQAEEFIKQKMELEGHNFDMDDEEIR